MAGENLTLVQAFCKLYDSLRIIKNVLVKESPDQIVRNIASEQIVGSNSYWESPDIENPEHSTARIFFDAMFGKNHTGGLVVDLYFKNIKLGLIMKVPSQSEVSGCASTAFDIKNFSGFRIVVKNQDVAHNTTIKNLRVVIW